MMKEPQRSHNSAAEGTGPSDRGANSQGTRRRRPSAGQPQPQSFTGLAAESMPSMPINMDDIESIIEDKDIPYAPPSLDYDADQAEHDQQRATAAAAQTIFGGWHYVPLIIALVPPLGTFLGGHADTWSDAILLLLSTFWLYQWMRVPWDMYALSRTRRILAADEEEEEDEQDTTLSEQERQARHRARLYSLTELQRTEYVCLLACMGSPFLGAYFLTWAQDSLTDGHQYLNAFNIRLFTMAAAIRPWMHGIALLRRRLLLLQEDVHYPSSRVEALKRKTKRLESDLSTLRKLVATKSDVSILREGIDVPLSQLSRAVRRNEKKEEHLRLSAEDKFVLVEARLDDLLREVAINAELIEEERRERERIARMPLVHVVQAVKLLVGSRPSSSSSSSYQSGRPHTIQGSRPVPQIQAASVSGNGSSRHSGSAAPPGSYSQSRAYMHASDPSYLHGGGPPPPPGGPQSYSHPSYHNAPGPISPPSSVRSPTNESSEPAWYAKGPMYYMFLPLNISNAALSFAQSKVSNLLEDASPQSFAYPGSPSYNQAHHQQPLYSSLGSASNSKRMGKKKQVKI